jgi:hypothetical protein
MKKFSIGTFKYGQLGTPERAPIPFPGIYPTRWDIRVGYRTRRILTRNPKNQEEEKIFAYFGKPNRMIARRLREIAANYYGTALVMEGDRGGNFQEALCGIPVLRGGMVVHNWNHPVMKFYYPFTDGDGAIITQWGDRLFNRARLKWNGRIWTVYSPDKVQQMSKIRDHKQWLSMQKWQ